MVIIDVLLATNDMKKIYTILLAGKIISFCNDVEYFQLLDQYISFIGEVEVYQMYLIELQYQKPVFLHHGRC